MSNGEVIANENSEFDLSKIPRTVYNSKSSSLKVNVWQDPFQMSCIPTEFVKCNLLHCRLIGQPINFVVSPTILFRLFFFVRPTYPTICKSGRDVKSNTRPRTTDYIHKFNSSRLRVSIYQCLPKIIVICMIFHKYTKCNNDRQAY